MRWFRRRSDGEPVLDLRDRQHVGDPGDCPRCGGGGYLDRIDVTHGIQHQHCRRCDHRWSVDFGDLDLDLDLDADHRSP